MNKKTTLALILFLLLAIASILGLPFMIRSIERRAGNEIPMITVTPYPVDEEWSKTGT